MVKTSQHHQVIYQEVNSGLNRVMDLKERRRLNLIKYRDLECGGSAAELARRIEKVPSYVTRMLYPADKEGARRMSEDMARQIETLISKPEGWLDRPVDGVPLSPPRALSHATKLTIEEEIQHLVTQMSARERIQLLGAAKLIIGMAKAPPEDAGKTSKRR